MASPDAGRALRPELSPAERRRLIERGIELFDRGAWFDCHEAFEEVWRSTTPEPRDLWQGLIQVAVGLHHALDRGRPEVGRRVLAKGRRRLARLPSPCEGIEVAALLAAVGEWERWLAAPEGEPPPRPRIGGGAGEG
jgi:predicted metal-dependent hydrolase